MIDFSKYDTGTFVKVTKVKDNKFDNKHPNNFNEGHVETGIVNIEESNKCQCLLIVDKDRFFHTSQVLDIKQHEGYDILTTLNSIYKVEPVMEAVPGTQEKISSKVG